jgi:hypothetical protein
MFEASKQTLTKNLTNIEGEENVQSEKVGIRIFADYQRSNIAVRPVHIQALTSKQ